MKLKVSRGALREKGWLRVLKGLFKCETILAASKRNNPRLNTFQRAFDRQ